MRPITRSLGFATVKPLEVLLTRDDVTLFDILDDRNLFLECKEKNPKLIDYLSKPNVLKQLLGFVLDEFEDRTVNRAKFQHVATEVLSQDLDAFVDGALANDAALLRDFWIRGMKNPANSSNGALMSQFSKVFVAFLLRKPHETFAFLQKQPDSLRDILRHLELPQVADMLLKILLLDRESTNEPVVDWLCEQSLMEQLIRKMSPNNDAVVQQAALESIKNIILMSSFTPTPGRKEASVLSSNRLSRNLVSTSNSGILIGQLFPSKQAQKIADPNTPHSASSSGLNLDGDVDAEVSSFMNAASTVMELIRKNNSDYFEQYLFLRAREHLMAVQEAMMQEEHPEGESTDCRPALEAAMEEIMAKCGLVNLGTLISAICDNLHVLQARLKEPRSLALPIPSTVGPLVPLTFERLRICELFGELLHYSNMLLPNRIPGTSPTYDEDGRLVGGLDALGDLAAAMMAEADPDAEEVESDEEEEPEEKPEEPAFPVSQQNRKRRSFASDSDSDGGSMLNEELKEVHSPADIDSGSSNEATSKGAGVSPVSSIENLVDRLSLVVPGSPKARRPSLSPFTPGTPPVPVYSKAGSVIMPPVEPDAIVDDDVADVTGSKVLSPGDALKSRFMELRIFPTLLDLVFQFPWNNFLHSVVYDIFHQVLFGKIEGTMNRDLIISLFRDVELPRRIMEAQTKNDTQPPSQPRLGYMGHITLMAVDIVSALEKYPDDLLDVIQPMIPNPAWDDYVHGVYAETQRLENTILGGPRPTQTTRGATPMGENGWGGDWPDGEDDGSSPIQEFRRTGTASKQTADFGPPDEEEEDTFHFTHASGFANTTGWGSSSSSDSGDEHDEWLRNSNSATASAHRRDAEEVGFDNAFDDDFEPSGDDGFGAWTDAGGADNQFTTDFEHDDFDFGETNRGQEIKVSLKDRIAALGLDNPSASTSNTPSNATPAPYLSSGAVSLPVAGVRDKAARFESIGGVPVPRGSFGLGAPPAFQGPSRAGELYGNRIPSGGRSPGSSPSRTLADDPAAPEFTRVKLRSISSAASLDLLDSTQYGMTIAVIPPSPALVPPQEDPPGELKSEVEPKNEPNVSDALETSNSPVAVSETASPLSDDGQEIEINTSPATAPVMSLEAIPESPANQAAPTPFVARPTIASKRRSIVLSSPIILPSTLEDSAPKTADPTATGHPKRSTTLSPQSTPRRTKSQASSRDGSMSSTGSVFNSPPSDEGEAPTVDFLLPTSPTNEPISPAPPTLPTPTNRQPSTIPSPARTEIPWSNGILSDDTLATNDLNLEDDGYLAAAISSVDFQPPEPTQKPTARRPSVLSTSELAYLQPTPPQSIEDGLNDDLERNPKRLSVFASRARTSTLPDAPPSDANSSPVAVSPQRRLSETLAETASPARVMRELRQLNMEHSSPIVISPPKRASVLSMMVSSPVTPVESDALLRSKPETEQRSPSPLRPNARERGFASGETRSRSPLTEPLEAPVRSSSLTTSAGPSQRGSMIDDVSPTTASVFSIPQSYSGTSDASHSGLSRASSPQDTIAFPTTLTTTQFSLQPFTTPVANSPTASIPTHADTADSIRTTSPSPPASFRSLYSAGRLPPSSRGPGPHPPTSKVPLLQRAVTLMSRALPPVPVEELPRRSASAFQAIRSRTSSKAKKEQAKLALDGGKRPETIYDDSSPRPSMSGPRMRTTSSPLVLSNADDTPRNSSSVPPVPTIPPVVITTEADDSTPIARMFMQKKEQSLRGQNAQGMAPSAFRSDSPSPSLSSTYGSMSSCGPAHLFSPSFDQGIFDAFPEVPDHLPTPSVIIRHTKGTRAQLGLMPNRSASELEGAGREVQASSPSKSDDGYAFNRDADASSTGTIKTSNKSNDVDEFGNQRPPGRRKNSSRKVIPGWSDEEDEKVETGWANVSITRARIA
ncbi:hypothetical protein PIIN_08510 [Serendipita indica DSM 11827]|uniref:Uncharacterized protein n=1 Tax=Serendipita indica (strain DSM 11827) TaxID=1109443 RepID=G4TTB5_SERID|nr:hypothetical protein PIIN_08510 [Serendipita indica DSM 11827]